MPTRYETRTINLALSVLREVLPRCAQNDVGTPAVRLALRILYRHAPAPAKEFWQHASSKVGHPWESGHHPYAAIVWSLANAGWEIDAENIR